MHKNLQKAKFNFHKPNDRIVLYMLLLLSLRPNRLANIHGLQGVSVRVTLII